MIVSRKNQDVNNAFMRRRKRMPCIHERSPSFKNVVVWSSRLGILYVGMPVEDHLKSNDRQFEMFIQGTF
jgi:hypothetical protein